MRPVAVIAVFGLMCVSNMVRGDGVSETAKTETVNLAKAQSDPFTAFIQHAFWPTAEVIAAKKCDRSRIDIDVVALSNSLATYISNDLMPSGGDLASAVGIPDYLNGDDYLFLRHTTESGVHVEVQECNMLYILLSFPSKKDDQLAEIGAFVKSVAMRTIRFPTEGGIEGNPEVFISTIDIGQSKCGRLYWRRTGDRDGSLVDWWSSIEWWSDGTRVLFGIPKMSKEDFAKLATRSRRSGYMKPRKFEYRKER